MFGGSNLGIRVDGKTATMSKDKPKFDDCLEVIDTSVKQTSITLDDHMDEDAVASDDWRSHWKGMPEFEQEEKRPFKKINVCFETEEDFNKFRELIGQSMTVKTKTIWFPEFDREANSLYKWISDEE